MGYILSPGSTKKSGAIISSCRAYRYLLWRNWGGFLDGFLSFIMLNPSTANALENDPTIRRCIAFAKREKLGGIQVVNLFAYRSPKPDDLKRVSEPIGPYNDNFIKAQIHPGQMIVLAWGVAKFQDRIKQVLDITRYHDRIYCLGTTKAGLPCHPLYLSASTPLVRFPL